MKKIYNIFLDDRKIGTTHLEYGDPPMGVVYGQADFINIDSVYSFFKEYCIRNKIEFTDYPEDKLISVTTIPTLQIKDEKGIEIKGGGNQISGIDSDTFEITIEGIPHPFYRGQFPEHVRDHEERFG